MGTKPIRGKGGSFDTKPNPFQNQKGAAKTEANFVEVADLGQICELLLDAGAALMVGRTRDGGAVVLTVLDGEDRHRTYCSNQRELDDAFDALHHMYKID